MNHKMRNPLQKAIQFITAKKLAKELGLSVQTVYEWSWNGKLPMQEYAGITSYAKTICKLCNNLYSVEQLLYGSAETKKARKVLRKIITDW